jgi:hypothetical protein
MPFVGLPPSARKDDVQTTLADDPGVAAARSCGRRRVEKNSVATQFVPIKGSRSCAVLSPISKEEMRAPALFHSTSSFASCWAKVLAAALTERRSLRSRCRNLMLPGVVGAGVEEMRALMAFSAFSWNEG